MKKICAFLMSLIFIHISMAQSCLPDGIIFSSQSQIDNFHNNYPGCTQIEGFVQINGYDITNLIGLNVLTAIGGSLNIHNNPNLTSLIGLNNITSIGTGLFVSNNNILINLSGLNSVNDIGGELVIDDNDSLITLSGLDNINSGSIGYLSIFDNIMLSSCHVQSICNYLANPTGSVNIYNNAVGCNNPPEVANSCTINLPCLPYGNYYFYCQDDIDNFQINYPNCTQIEGDVSIKGNSITNLNGLINIKSISGNLTIYNNDSLINLSGLDSLSSIGQTLFIYYNPILTNLVGINGLISIGDQFHLFSNYALTSLTGVNALTSVGGSLIIDKEPSMTALSDLINLTSIGGDLFITDNEVLTSLSGLDNIDAGSIIWLAIYGNSSLSTCEVQSVCDYLANPNGSIAIYNNATGCNSQYEVELACGVGVEENNIFENYFSFYPNPASTKIIIETNRIGFLSILNLNNQEIAKWQLTEHKTLIDISNLPRSVYIIRFQNEEIFQTRKLIKQ